jgi:hypothetical protein
MGGFASFLHSGRKEYNSDILIIPGYEIYAVLNGLSNPETEIQR